MITSNLKTTVMLVGLFTGMSVFAQHPSGTSGPDNSTYQNHNPLATSDTILTHAQLQTIMSGCMDTEVLKIVSTLAKANDLVPINNSLYDFPGIKELDDSGLLSYARTYSGASENSVSNSVVAQVTWNQSLLNINFNPYFQINLYFDGAPFNKLNLGIPQKFPPVALIWDETPLTDAYDEYGRANLEKIIVSNLRWSSFGMDSKSYTVYNGFVPSMLNTTYPIYNTESTNGVFTPVQGVSFDLASYSSCIDSKTGLIPVAGVQVPPSATTGPTQ